MENVTISAQLENRTKYRQLQGKGHELFCSKYAYDSYKLYCRYRFIFIARTGYPSNNIFWGKIMMLIARLIIFLIVLQILSVLIYSFIGPAWEAKAKRKTSQESTREEILETYTDKSFILQAKIDTENDIFPPNNVERSCACCKILYPIRNN